MPILQLPDDYDYRVMTMVPITQASGAGGMALSGKGGPPPGYTVYGGSSIWTNVGRDGLRYFVMTGDTPQGFRPFAFRSHPDGRHEILPLDGSLITDVGCWVVENPQGAEIIQYTGARSVTIVPLPGYQPRDYVGELPPVVAPQPLPEQPTPTEAIDEGARSYTTAVKQELYAVIAALRTELEELRRQVALVGSHPVTSAELNAATVRDVIWNDRIVVDKMFAELKDRNSGVSSEVAAIAREQISR